MIPKGMFPYCPKYCEDYDKKKDTVRTMIRRKICNKSHGKTSVKKLVKTSVIILNTVMFKRQSIQYIKNRSYTGVSTSVWYNSSCTILDTLQYT